VVLAASFLVTGCACGLVFHPDPWVRTTPASLGLAYEDVVLETDDGERLRGWWVPAGGAWGTVVFFHGNGGNMSSCLDAVETAHRLRLNIFLFDYRGYGRSTGTPTERGLFLDADAACAHVLHERGVSSGTVVLWGRSLGGAVAAYAASRYHVSVLVLESTFVSVPRLAEEHVGCLGRKLFLGCTFDTLGLLAKTRVPVLVVHSRDDEIVPFDHGRTLYDAAAHPKTFVEIQGSHNQGAVLSRAVFERELESFLNAHLPCDGKGGT